MSGKAPAVLVTGACGSLGSAAVKAFADAGCRVFAVDVRPYTSDRPSVTPIVTDTSDEEGVKAALLKVEAETDGLEAVVHLAGLYTMDSFIEIEPEALRRMLDANLMGVAVVDRVFLPLVMRGRGRIVIVASELAPLDPLPFNGIYSMTKRALDADAHSLALELDLIGVKVVTVYPGAYGDGMTKGAIRAMDAMREKTKLYPGVTERFRDIVANETGKPKDPAVLAALLTRIVRAKRPRFRYFPNNSIKLRLFSALPMNAQAFLLRKLLKGKKC